MRHDMSGRFAHLGAALIGAEALHSLSFLHHLW